jgi:pimeloyl-ACP methyl ester carboxylesterase
MRSGARSGPEAMDLAHGNGRVFLADQGRRFDPTKPTLLLVHGAGMDHSVWPLQARHFAYRGWNALALDLPGHGRSDGPLLTSIEAMADWLARLIDGLGIARAALVGHSMGALVALACAARAPEKIERIALLGAAPAMPVHPALLEAAARPEPLGPRMICDWGFGPAGHFGGHRSPGSWMLGHALALLGRSAGPRLHADLAACDAYQAGLDDAARIACPTLVVAGALDRMTPARQGARLAGAITGATFVALPGCGHMMMVEKPDATRDALSEFLAKSQTVAAG